LKIRVLSVLIATVCSAGLAQARQPPAPPPSGIVVHLFGAGSVTSNFFPSGPAPGTPSAPGNDTANDSGGAVASGTGQHGILYQMFVSGDPNVKPGQTFSTGKAGN